jgi:microcystin-dependent protein
MKRKLLLVISVILLVTKFACAQEAFVGQIVLFAGNFEPRGWAFCDGRILPIAQNTALFSLLGTTYGGDGRTTFALPDLRGRVPVGRGQGPGLSDYTLGESAGEESVTLLATEMPAHAHGLNNMQITCDNTAATSNSPVSTIPAKISNGTNSYSTTTNASMHTSNNMIGTSPAGGSQPHNNNKPYLAVNYIIALQGIFPPRN